MVEKLEKIAKEVPKIGSLDGKKDYILKKILNSDYKGKDLTVADDWCDCDCHACNSGCYICE